jgi:hypothetical protein
MTNLSYLPQAQFLDEQLAVVDPGASPLLEIEYVDLKGYETSFPIYLAAHLKKAQ